MRRAWFAYTAGSKGPIPNIFYDELPNEKNCLNPSILQKWELDKSWGRDSNDELISGFYYLSISFPYTGNHYDIGEKVKLEEVQNKIPADSASGMAE